jgi:hypothetical protein
MTAPDIFALGVADSEILALFRRWIEGRRAAAALDDTPECAEWSEAIDEIDKIECDITATPAVGAIGLAVKVYLAMYHESGGTSEEAAALGTLDDGSAHGALYASLIRDAALFVPEIGPLATRIAQPRQAGAAGDAGIAS